MGIAGLRLLEITVYRYVFHWPITLPVNVFIPCLLLHYFLHYVRDPSCSVLIFLSHLLGENLRESGNTRL